MFISFPYEPRKLEATEARLEAIMKAARLGLKGDSLALAAGMTPAEYRQLVQFDPIAEYAENKARAEGELRASELLHMAAENGDSKAALAILQNVHGWVAKQQVQIDVEQRISIVGALESASKRVEQALQVIEHDDITDVTPIQIKQSDSLEPAPLPTDAKAA